MSKEFYPFVISFEGLPGAGKTTLSKLLAGELFYRNIKVELLKPFERNRIERVFSAFDGERKLLWINRIPFVPPKTAASLLLGILSADTPNKDVDVWVFDRHVDSVFAGLWAFYVSNGEEIGLKEFYRWFYTVARQIIRFPTVTFYLKTDLHDAIKRVEKYKRMMIDDAMVQQLELMKDAYDFLAKKEKDRVLTISSTRPLYMFREVLMQVSLRIEGKQRNPPLKEPPEKRDR